jgi:glucose/arabinose dehydrogenase
MFSRVLKPLGIAAAVSASAAATAPAATGPPPPTTTNGHAVQLVASGLHTPTSFAFGGGNVFEGDGGAESGPPNGGVFLLKGGSATKLPGSPGFVAGLAWRRGTLYVSGGNLTSSGAVFQLQAWSGWNGATFTKRKAIYTAPKKFDGFNGLAFGSDGRLYVGVDLGLTNNNDHRPANTSPYLYDILSIKPNGKDVRVFASGIRQPWQMAFPKGSSSPFVSDLGQDKGAKNPPDFLLRVRKGDSYGFPQCTWIKASACKGFAKPFKMFSPHTDVMGVGIIGSQLYLSEFLGNKGKSGLVVTMPIAGGTPKTLVTGFVAPVVGLGVNAGYVYIGELTGQVFRVKA